MECAHVKQSVDAHGLVLNDKMLELKQHHSYKNKEMKDNWKSIKILVSPNCTDDYDFFCLQYIEFSDSWEAYRHAPCVEFLIRDRNFSPTSSVCVVDVFQEGHDGESAAVSVSTRPRKVQYCQTLLQFPLVALTSFAYSHHKMLHRNWS